MSSQKPKPFLDHVIESVSGQKSGSQQSDTGFVREKHLVFHCLSVHKAARVPASRTCMFACIFCGALTGATE